MCRLVADGKANDGRRVRVRAAFGSGADYVRLFDNICPSSNVFVKGVRGDVDPTLCSSKDLSKTYGCPVNGDSGVRGTFTGTYHFVSKDVGRLDVEEISSVSKDL